MNKVMSEGQIKRFENPEERLKMSQSAYKMHENNPAVKIAASIKAKEIMADPVKKAKIVAKRNKTRQANIMRIRKSVTRERNRMYRIVMDIIHESVDRARMIKASEYVIEEPIVDYVPKHVIEPNITNYYYEDKNVDNKEGLFKTIFSKMKLMLAV